jgi:hypothetical protein
MAEPLLFSPRLEGLLREMAADPRSSLLRVPRPARLGVVLERRPLVGMATAGLTLAERELVRAHREELAMLLRELAVALLHASPQAAVSHLRARSSDHPVRVESPAEWRERATRQLRGNGEQVPSSACELLLRCTRDEALGPGTPIAEVLAAAAQCQPTDQGCILWAQDLIASGDFDTAASLLAPVALGPASAVNRACSIANQAWIASKQGQPARAADLYRTAAALHSDVAIAPLSWLTTSFDAMDASSARDAARMLNARLAEGHAAVVEFAELTSAQLRVGVLSRSARSRALARTITDDFDGSARFIAHAYAF